MSKVMQGFYANFSATMGAVISRMMPCLHNSYVITACSNQASKACRLNVRSCFYSLRSLAIIFTVILTIYSVLFSAHSTADTGATLAVKVIDKYGQPIPDIIVSAHGSHLPPSEPMLVYLGQDRMRFYPQISVVPLGSEVVFSNHDNITHHVYSFSAPWKRQFRLASGTEQKHRFDKPGLVVLGCNIHDWMLSYVYVMDTALYSRTNDNGIVTFQGVPSGTLTLKVQHPRIRDNRGNIQQTLELTNEQQLSLIVPIKKSLLPKRNQIPDFDIYE